MTAYDTECRFCRNPMQVEIDPDYIKLRGGLLGDIPTLTKLAACNRCADFEDGKRKIKDATERAARTLSLELYASRSNSDPAKKSREAIRILFSRWFEHVCRHHRINVAEDREFVELIFEKPEKWLQAYHTCEMSCRRIARDQRQKGVAV